MTDHVMLPLSKKYMASVHCSPHAKMACIRCGVFDNTLRISTRYKTCEDAEGYLDASWHSNGGYRYPFAPCWADDYVDDPVDAATNEPEIPSEPVKKGWAPDVFDKDAFERFMKEL